MTFKLIVNKKSTTVDVPADMPLLWEKSNWTTERSPGLRRISKSLSG